MIELEKYDSQEELEETVHVLEKHGFEYQVHSQVADFDPSFSAKEVQNQFSIKVKKDDLVEINKCLNEQFKSITFESIPKDYYLLEFGDEELLEVLLKPDEWSRHDYNLSQTILTKRGHNVSVDTLNKMTEKRLAELRKPENFDIDFTWLLNLFFGSITGGLWSIYLSWGHLTLKKTLPNGELVYVYDNRSRRNAEKMLWLSIAITVVWLIGIFGLT